MELTRLTTMFQGNEDLNREKTLFLYQRRSIISLIFLAILTGFIEWLWPDFFNYPFFSWDVDTNSLFNFWPLFLYAAVMATLSGMGKVSTWHDESILTWGTITSIFAGIWEEVGFRCFFICTSMIGIVWTNWLLGGPFGPIICIFIGLVFIVGAMWSLTNKEIFPLLGCILGAMVFFWLSSVNDPIYWVYQEISIPFLSFLSVGLLDGILYGGYEELFIMGAIVANTKFRDGHKYQGPIGTLNSWIIGFVFLYTMLNYGLLTAIAVHILYDIEFSVVHYLLRKINS